MAGSIRADFPPNPKAESLIRGHVHQIPSKASYLARWYPATDLEPYISSALYLAAYSYDGRCNFRRWWNIKVRGQLSGVRRKATRKIKTVNIGDHTELIDEIYSLG